MPQSKTAALLDKYLSISFVPKAHSAIHFDAAQNRAIQILELILEVNFGTVRDGSLTMQIPNITKNQWNNFDVTVTITCIQFVSTSMNRP